MTAGRYQQAVDVGRRMVELADQDFRNEPLTIAQAVNFLAVAYNSVERYADAEPLIRRALAIFEAHPDTEMQNVATGYNNLASVVSAQGRLAEAESLHNKALQLRIKLFGPDSDQAAISYNNIAKLYSDQNRYAEAEPLLERTIAIWTKTRGPNNPSVATTIGILAGVKYRRGRYNEAEKLYQQSLSIRAQTQGRKHPQYVDGLFGLGEAYQGQGRYDEAIKTFQEGLAILEEAFGPDHVALAGTLVRMGETYEYQGRYADAERALLRAKTIREKGTNQDAPATASLFNSLGLLYNVQGRFAEAEATLRRALAMMERLYGRDHRNTASAYNNLAAVFRDQGRFGEAEPLYKLSLQIMEKVLDPDHPNIAATINNLGMVAQWQGRTKEAEALFKKALELRTKVLGPEHHVVAIELDNLATIYWQQGRYAEAEPLNRRAVEVLERRYGADHLDVAKALTNLAYVLDFQGKSAEAEPLLNRSIASLERMQASASTRYLPYRLRAKIAWRAGRHDQAIADLRRAMELAEEAEARGAGLDFERANLFGRFADAYDQMTAWQAERGDVAQAAAAIERGRARTLLEQMRLGGADLLAGLPADQAAPLRQREADAKGRLAALERRARQIESRSDLAPEERQRQIASLDQELIEARRAAVEAARDIRNASPAYRIGLDQNRQPADPSAIRDWASKRGALVLEYALGGEGGFVLIVPPDGAPPRLEKLAIGPEEAQILGVDVGPLTSNRLRAALSNGKTTGVLQQLSSPAARETASDVSPEPRKPGPERLPSPGAKGTIDDRLAAIWSVLVPSKERAMLTAGRIKCLVVLPDGPLALLPFESLVVERGGEPRYFLDAGPPVLYAPSATVLLNMTERPEAPRPADREPVLALGDPAYGEVGAENPSPTVSLAASTSQSRYGIVGGRLKRLPFSGAEVRAVVDDYSEAGVSAASLTGATATERGLRYWAPGRRVLHLACHGLADQQQGNFFGALALAPGPKGPDTPSDDGFLTLPEIYELNLKGCELAILSACQTNYGPEQKGEGTWGLSRGFIVAGSRRVVASNWLVDDESTASLVHAFCKTLAQAEKDHKPLDHAAALQAAKRYIRQQEKWKSPYYWASMVLIGPP